MDKIKKTDHFYLIDGSGYIFRAYYALPPLSRKSDGMPTGAVNGFCNMLFKLLEDSKSNENKDKPTHFAVIFDSARKNFRNEIFSDYKANRSDAPDDLIPQFEYIRKSVEAFNLPSIEMINYEADDLIATYVEHILEIGAKVTIVSSDKDMKTVPCILLRNGELETISEKRADRNWMVQVLCGDRCDNIPGLVGVGPKTAEKILGDSETLSDMWDKVIGAYEKRKLTYKSALLSARLTRILRHGEYNLHKQEVSLWEPPTT